MEKKKMKVLFIGNSHTYYNDMVYMVSFLSRQRSNTPEIEGVMLAHGGKRLAWHSGQQEVRFNILHGNYDYVVLQEATSIFEGEELIFEGVESINNYITLTKSKLVTYMTWEHKTRPEHQQVMTDAYIKLAKELRGLLVPAGIAWDRVLKELPEVELFNKDGRHASPEGSYLVACVFYSVLLGASPEGLPSVIDAPDKRLVDIPADLALKLQRIAWETVQGMK